MQEIGKVIIILGLILVSVGLLLFLMNKVPLAGKLPGDILIKKEHITFYFPLGTSLILSVIVSAALFFLMKKQ
jgi:multisubunit Na+/H+ antiporter MnhC subunit